MLGSWRSCSSHVQVLSGAEPGNEEMKTMHGKGGYINTAVKRLRMCELSFELRFFFRTYKGA